MIPQPQPQPQPTPRPTASSWRARLPLVRPVAIYVFLAISVLVFLAMELRGGSQNPQTLIAFGANYAPLVAGGQYWRLITANFLHIGWLHLLVNMYALYVLGGEVEALFGHSRFVVIYLLTGISGAILSFMLTQGLSAGASTSLFGLFGALVIFFYRQRTMLGNFGQQRLISLGLTLVINVIIGLSPGSPIDMWGHVGGFLGGLVLAWFLCPQYVRVDPFANAFAPAMNATPELTAGTIMDSNSLAKQSFSVGLFALGLMALTVIARLVQQQPG